MTRTRLFGLLAVLFCVGFSVAWDAIAQQRAFPYGMEFTDFKGVYYPALCLLRHSDPYKADQPLRLYQSQTHDYELAAGAPYLVLSRCVYPPTALILLAPFALLPWGLAHVMWTALTMALVASAAFLILDLAADDSLWTSLFLLCALLANCETLFASGNPAGPVIGLCAIAVWCFLRERFVAIGVMCLAAALAIKPHDAGLVWLYFLLAGGVRSRLALKTLALVALLTAIAVLIAGPISPHWLMELRSNLAAAASPGGLSDPTSASASIHGLPMIVDLQAILSVFWREAQRYNAASYTICGVLLTVWSVAVVRMRFSIHRAKLALAAIAPLTLLPDYHRSYDILLLMLMIPACASLAATPTRRGWTATLVTGAGFLVTAEIPLALFGHFTRGLHASTASLAGKLITITTDRPVAPVLLLLSIFYLAVCLSEFAPRDRLRFPPHAVVAAPAPKSVY